MSKLSVEAKVGVFVVIGIILLAYMSMKVGKLNFSSNKGYYIEVLFDSATGLDPIRRDDIDRLIMRTQEQTGATCLVISHDIDSTFKIAHTVAMLYDGRIIEYGVPDKIRHSTNPVVKHFIEGKSSSEQ